MEFLVGFVCGGVVAILMIIVICAVLISKGGDNKGR